MSCQAGLDRAEGKEVTTLEGFEPAERQRLAAAFAATGALQCGFCTPGILVRVKSLLDKKGSDLDRDTAARHLGGHLCRCTGYTKILDAVEDLAQGVEVPVALPTGIGTSGARYEGEPLALGDKLYIDDLQVPGLLHAAVRLSDHARADVLAIDTTAARAHPGVEAVFTAADIPGVDRVGIIHQDWPVMIGEGARTSYLGDVMAMVVAVDRPTARAAAALIDIDYRVLEPFADPFRALANGADDAVWTLPGNVLSRSTYARGDAEAALAASAHVVRETFQTQRVEHAFLEPESTLAVPGTDGAPLHVYSGGQGVWDDRDQIAAILGIGTDEVTVELVSNGGAFGGKEDMSNQGQTALAAHLLGRPVKCTFSREESLLVHAKRHPIHIEAEAACDADGRLTALRCRMVGDSGPYASVGMKVLERAAGHASGPYVVPNIDVEAVAVRTNNPVCGAFRGFGANQAQFAMEGLLDRLAEQVGITGWEIRDRNVVSPGDVWGPGQILDDGCKGARSCLDAVKPAIDAARAKGHAVGVGLGLKNSGLGNGFHEVSKAVVRFDDAGDVEVRHGWTEMGQGIHTVALQVACTELGIAPERVSVVVDTTRELGKGQTTGSRGTLMGAGAVRDACRAALAADCAPGVDHEGSYVIDWTNKLSDGIEHPIIHSTFGYAAQVVVVDRESGEVVRVVAAHDVGRAVNPLLVEGQIEGAVHMGLGYALSEDFPTDEDARPTVSTLRGLNIIRPQGHGAGRGHAHRGGRAQQPLWHQGRGRDRSGAHRRRGGRRPPRPRWTVAGPPAHAGRPFVTGPPPTVIAPRTTPSAAGATGEGAVTAGLVCGHHHLYSTLARGMAPPPRVPRSFLDVLELVWWRLDRALDLDTIYHSARLGALEALSCGTTAIIDHHSSPNAIDGSLSVITDACAEVGVRVRCAYEVTDRNGAEGARAGLAENERFLRAGGRGLVGAHAAFTLSEDTLDAVCALATDLGVGVHIHVAEGLDDLEAGRRLDRRTDDRWLLAHAVHLDRPLAGTIAHNPRSNQNNSVGYGHPAQWQAAGQRVVLGTDGIGADMVEEARVAFAAHRADELTAEPTQAWSWLETGYDLVPEARHDRVAWNYGPMDPWHLAYTTGVHPTEVVIDGEVVFDADGPTRVDAEEVRAHAAAAATRLHARMADLS